MKICPYCGQENDDVLENCHACNTALPATDVSTSQAKRFPNSLKWAIAIVLAALVMFFLVTTATTRVRHFDGMTIQGKTKFNDQVVNALILLRKKSPDAYQIVTNNIGLIRQARRSAMLAYEKPPTFELNRRSAFHSLTWCASGIAHDSLHSKFYHDFLRQHPGTNSVPDEIWTGEAVEWECCRHQTRVLKEIGAPEDEIWWSGQTNDRYWEVEYEKRDW